jgi:hypothetical protein
MYPLAVLVEIRHAVLSRDVEPATELRIVVDQTVQTHEGDPEIVGAVNLIRIWRVAEQHAESRIPGHCGFSYPIENAGGSEPQTTATVFACVTFLASLLRGGARVPTRCRSDALALRALHRPRGRDATARWE